MNELEKKLLKEAVGDKEPQLCIRTRTKVDAGRWGRKAPLWLCIVDGKIVLLSVARRMYILAAPLLECVGSEYCHATGQLVLKPIEGVDFDHIAMSPADALKVLAEIEKGIPHAEQRAAADTASGSYQ